MRKLIMKMSVSLDGFVADANGGKDWMFKTIDDESTVWSAGLISEAGLIIMGRKSFEMMSPYWPTAKGPFAEPMNTVPKAVFTQSGFTIKSKRTKTEPTPAKASWTEARVFDGDLAANIKELKKGEGKPIIAIGGAGFMHSLIATGLIDEYHLALHPVALGAGLPLFTEQQKPLYLKLTGTKAFPKGVVVQVYRK